MKKILALLTVLVLVSLAGCVSKYQARWTKPDLVMSDFKKADSECIMYADPIAYQAGAAYADNLFQESLMQDAWVRAYENCMTSKGYTKVGQ